MIIRFFKTSYPLQYGALLVLALLLWFPAFVGDYQPTGDVRNLVHPGYTLLLNIIPANSLAGPVFAFILNLAAALLLNYVLEKHEVTPRNSLVPAFVFVIFTGFNPQVQWPNETIIPLLFIILVLSNVLDMYNIEEAYTQVFNAGALIALASLFSFESIFFILFIYSAYFVFRIYSWREWVIPLIGFITMYFFLWIYFFWTGNINSAFEAYSGFFRNIEPVNISGPVKPLIVVLDLFVLLFGLWSMIRIISGYSENILILRKKLTVILWFALVALIITLLSGSSAVYNQLFLISALAMLTSIGLALMKRLIWVEIILGIMIIIAVFNNYLNLVF